MPSIYKRVSSFFYNLKWENGVCNELPARKNRFTKEVQFVLWKRGQHGHASDYWIAFDRSHWDNFWSVIDFKKS